MNPRVAVITRTRERPEFLARACESVLGQQFGDWHHYIVNDGGSKKKVQSVLRPYRDDYGKRLTVIHLDGEGMVPAANAGLERSNEAFITIHDDDDS